MHPRSEPIQLKFIIQNAVTESGKFPPRDGVFNQPIRIKFTNGTYLNFTDNTAVSLETYIPASVQILKGRYYFDGDDWQFSDYQAQAVDTTKNFKILTQEGDRLRTVDKTALDALSTATANTRIAANNTALNLKNAMVRHAGRV